MKGERSIVTMTHLYEELKPAEMEAPVSATPLAYVPSGTLEWHSTHLPFDLDALKAHGLCKLAAEGPLDGVLGEDPRRLASQESGARMRDIIVSRMATMAGRQVHHTSLRQRSAFIEAIASQVRVVEAITMEHRAKGRYARQLATDDYADMLLLLYKGDYAAATECAILILHELDETTKESGGLALNQRSGSL
jgi:hypothetical protein